MTTFNPEPVPAAAQEWWANCFPQWKGMQHMTTPTGRPSVEPSPRDLGEQLQDMSIAQTQAGATGRMRAGEPSPKIVGQYMDDVAGRYTEGATVSDDQAQETVTGTQPAP